MLVIPYRADDFSGTLITEESGTFFKGAAGRYMFILRAPMAGETEETLYVGDVQNHLNLLQLAEMERDQVGTMRERYLRAKARIQEAIATWTSRIIGGGICDGNGEVISWQTYTFHKETPVEWRSSIEQVLRQHLRVTNEEDPDITLS
jgi:hypothetical protein